MKIISIFNNKGGVGKTTLTFHLAHALALLKKKVLIMDVDPQCNLTIHGMDMEEIHKIWEEEDEFVEDFQRSRDHIGKDRFDKIISRTRTVHFLLKPTEDGVADLDNLPPPRKISNNLYIVPGRLTMHKYENKVAERWGNIYQGDPLSIRTATRVRSISEQYGRDFEYDFIIVDTSPSLGALNRMIMTTTDAFIVPCMPDLFSLYGIRNIGGALSEWKQQFDMIFHFLSPEKRKDFPAEFVQFLGYTIYNARKRQTDSNPYDLTVAAYGYARKIPDTIKEYIGENMRGKLSEDLLSEPIGKVSVMHTHNTFPSMAQKYRCPMWEVPNADLEPEDRTTIPGNKARYYETKDKYVEFARDFISRINLLGN